MTIEWYAGFDGILGTRELFESQKYSGVLLAELKTLVETTVMIIQVHRPWGGEVLEHEYCPENWIVG